MTHFFIELSRGFKALVDEQDYHHLRGMGWHAHTSKGFTYARCAWGNGHILMHVYLMKPPEGLLVDHINGDKLDNRRENLRLATNAENSRNVRKTEGRTSQYKGVVWDAARKKWRAQIKLEGSMKTLGRFEDERTAAQTYDEAAKLHFKEYAFLNFPIDVKE